MSNWYKKAFKNSVGYKIVSWNGQVATSLYDRKKRINLNIGSLDYNIYLGTTREFCINYYTGETDDQDMLLTYLYDPKDIISGFAESNSEIVVREAQLKSIEILDQNQESIQFDSDLEELQNYIEAESIDPLTTYSRYVFIDQTTMLANLSNGLIMNHGHGSLPNEWNYLHVGDEEWVSILRSDYGRDGSVCQLEISNLPNGFYVAEDPDVNIKGKVGSWIIISKKFNTIPKECVEIINCNDSSEYPELDEGFWERT